jgi:hypothetical protein
MQVGSETGGRRASELVEEAGAVMGGDIAAGRIFLCFCSFIHIIRLAILRFEVVGAGGRGDIVHIRQV